MSATRVKVTCDACEKDITATGNVVDYRLVLRSEAKGPWYREEGRTGGAVTAMHIPDPLPQNKHFCDLGCLTNWIEGREAHD